MEIRFDGLYQSEARRIQSGSEEIIGWEYLRFYKDGTVLSVVSSGSPKEVSRWLCTMHKNVLKGKYRKRKDQITFSLQLSSGQIDYDGTVYQDDLSLTILSHITGSWSVQIFRFVPWWNKEKE